MGCSVEGCNSQLYAKSFCNKHYQRFRASGHTELRPRHLDVVTRFWSKVDKTSSCWLWTGYLRKDGYCQLKVFGKMQLGHRWAYEQAKGKIPEGKCLDHLCGNRSCVQPDHLEPVTIQANTLRSLKAPAAINARKTQCPKGHNYDDENTIVLRGKRFCRKCRKQRLKC